MMERIVSNRFYCCYAGLSLVLWVAAPAMAGVPASKGAATGYVEPAPGDFDGIAVAEQVGAQVPTELQLRSSDGNATTLAEVLAGELPTILTFNYSDCPMLCNMQLSALSEAMEKLPLVPGRQFQVVTVVLNPDESVERAAETKASYLARFPQQRREAMQSGWHFLLGDKAAIDALAEAVGFAYKYLPERNEYAHPATLILLSPSGRVNQYLHGIQYQPADLNQAIFRAGLGEEQTSLGYILSCFHYDAEANSYADTGEGIMRYGAMGFVLIMLATFGVWQFARARKSSREAGSS